MLKYGHNKFNLEILEYCDKNFVIEKKQQYINLLKPVYSILSKAGSSLDFKHCSHTMLKFKTRKLRAEALANSKKVKLNPTFSSLAKTNLVLTTGHKILVMNKLDGDIKKYNSIQLAGEIVR